MKVFWRTDDLSEHESELLRLCLEAHSQSAWRNNASSTALTISAHGSGNYASSLICGLSTLGGSHAPLIDSWRVLHSNSNEIDSAIEASMKIPGWGNSFEKGDVDALWKPIADHIQKHFSFIHEKINSITEKLHACGKKVYPNPSIFTAATGLILKMPPQILPWLFIQGRLNAWTMLYMQSVQPKGES